MSISKEQRERSELLKQLAEIEFAFFSTVQNEGGTASCQNDRKTFDIMRGAQFCVWSDESLASWLQDLLDAKEEGRNPFTEKYGYMMASTYPEEYERIKDMLPAVPERKKEMAKAYIASYLHWEEECQKILPHFCAKGRPLYSAMDTAYVTSKETYLRGELYTYSERTLACLSKDLSFALAAGRNLVMETYDVMAQSYGYASAIDCERKIGQA